MKVFVAKIGEKYYKSLNNYNWCDQNELLMFTQFYTSGNPSNVSMCGIKSRKFTTEIIVKDMEISKEFFKELLTESVEKAFQCTINQNGSFEIDILLKHKFNINDMIEELLQKANVFEDGQKVKCIDRDIIKETE